MNYRPIGSPGVRVSPLAPGTTTFGMASFDEDAVRLVGRALDLGIDLRLRQQLRQLAAPRLSRRATGRRTRFGRGDLGSSAQRAKIRNLLD